LRRGLLAMAGGRSPWGGGDRGSEAEGDSDQDQPDGASADGSDGGPPRGPRNPWLPPGEGQPRRSANIEDIFRGRDQRRPRGPGGGLPRLPQRPDGKSWVPLIVGAIVLLWLGISSVHVVGPKEAGIVTTFGRYSGTIAPGVSMTFPWPVQSVKLIDVTIQRDSIPEGESEKLMLTSDQNLVDFTYLVRWFVQDPKRFEFQLDDPRAAVVQVAEAAMRASVAEVPLVDVIGGAGRAQIEQNTRDRMQAILDTYRAGIAIQGVEIRKADPPAKVNAAFQRVTAAQQDAERMQSEARAWARQLTERSLGDAAAFDKVYAEYKLAPEVTKRRMYYETMERVLSNNDKVIIEADGVTPYLPLQEVRRNTPSPQQPVEEGQ
jgi:modulator of FtsH protease HflK